MGAEQDLSRRAIERFQRGHGTLLDQAPEAVTAAGLLLRVKRGSPTETAPWATKQVSRSDFGPLLTTSLGG